MQGVSGGVRNEVGGSEACGAQLEDAAVGGVELVQLVDSSEVGGEKNPAFMPPRLFYLYMLRPEHAAEAGNPVDAVASVRERRGV